MGPGETPRLVRMPLTYTKDANRQTVFLDIHKIFGMDYVRDAVISDISTLAPRKIIREGGATTIKCSKTLCWPRPTSASSWAC